MGIKTNISSPENGQQNRTDSSQGDEPTGISISPESQINLAWQDFLQSIDQSWFWLALGWNDIVQRYRGSILGPFWLTLTTGIFITGLGPLYAKLFGLNVREYLPFMALGIICWNFVVGTINESARGYIDAGPVMQQIKMPRTLPILHTLWRNVIIFAHNLPVVILVMIYAGIPVGWNTLAFIPGFALLCINLLWISLVVAIVSARYRDVVQIISSILMLLFFLTPVMWNPNMHRVPGWFINLNPFAAYIELVRAPLLNLPISTPLLIHASISAVVGTVFSTWMFARYRKYIIYWI